MRCSATTTAFTWRPGRRFDPELARLDHVTLVVQVDGKVRDRIDVEPDLGDDAARELALASPKAARAIDGREIARVIVRAPRLVNVVTR